MSSNWKERALNLRSSIGELIKQQTELKDLEQVRQRVFSKASDLSTLMASIRDAAHEERAAMGSDLNKVRSELQQLFDAQLQTLTAAQESRDIESQRIDVTLPGRNLGLGGIHPINQMLSDLLAWFDARGFTTVETQEIEDDWHNFEALNVPESHPAREMQDTFYFGSGSMLRTQTSSAQIRTMSSDQAPPHYIVSPGRVYRRDEDQSHTPMFHQVEGMIIDRKVSIADLQGILTSLVAYLFGEDKKMRVRPSYFPFTEPSVEVDVWFDLPNREPEWLEVLGAGLVHPNVLRKCNLDPAEWQGLAFGIGIERLVMLKWGLADIRLLFQNDVRDLRQLRC